MQMKKIVIIICMLILFAPIKADASDGSSYVYDGYIYDFWGNALDSPAAFTLERVIDESNLEGIKLLGVDDVCASKVGAFS